MQKRPLSMGCLIIVVLLAACVCLFHSPPEGYEAYEGDTLCLKGTVYQKEEKQSGLAIYLKEVVCPEGIISPKLKKGCRIVCYLAQDEKEPELGSVVQVKGKLRSFRQATNPGQFDARSYYQILQISFGLYQTSIQQKSKDYDILHEKLYRFRRCLSAKLSDYLPEEEASLMKTILLGEKGELEEEVKLLYQRNGIAHILAISGLHISMLGMGFYRVVRRIGTPCRIAAVGAGGVVFLFGIMTGFSVSAIRAILMFLLQMLAVVVGRTYDMITAIAVASVLILLGQPLYLFHTGFLFSFGCVLGIALLDPVLTNIHARCFVWKKLLSGLSMVIVTLPVSLFFFSQTPVYSMFLNFLVLPLMSILMAAGIVLLISSFAVPPVANVSAYVIAGILRIYESAGNVAQDLPYHYWTPGKPSLLQVILYLGILIAIAAFGRNQRKSRRKTENHTKRFRGIPIGFCWIMAEVAVLIIALRFPPDFQMTFLDVGQGDCIFFRTGKEKAYLVDGGSSSVSQVGKYRILPFLKYHGADELEAVFVTHPDEDHCNGIIELLEQGKREGITVHHLVLPDIDAESKTDEYRKLEETAQQSGIPISYLHAGQKLSNGELEITCIHPTANYVTDETNEFSMVLCVRYESLAMVLTGDVEGEGERCMTEHLKLWLETQSEMNESLTIVKVAHHGSKNSTSEEFLKTLCPHLAIISCGEKNRYGHPHEETLNRLESYAIPHFCTKDKGALTIEQHRGKARIYGYKDLDDFLCEF